MVRFITLACCLGLIACSSDGDDDKPKTSNANPCATPGATYLQTSTVIDGNCGDIPAQIINIGNDGTLSEDPIQCDRIEQDGCRAHNTNCVLRTADCTNTFTFTTTFEDDGSSASGLTTMKISCKDGSSCLGTYSVEMVRQ